MRWSSLPGACSTAVHRRCLADPVCPPYQSFVKFYAPRGRGNECFLAVTDVGRRLWLRQTYCFTAIFSSAHEYHISLTENLTRNPPPITLTLLRSKCSTTAKVRSGMQQNSNCVLCNHYNLPFCLLWCTKYVY